MGDLKRLAALGVMAVLALGGPRAGAEEKAHKVGAVLDIDGPRLMTNRLREASWYQAYPSMPTFLSEKLKSDAHTTATLEFAIGGRAVISPSTEIEISGQRQIETVGNKVVVNAGKMWANIDKQSSQLQIQTAGGTLGIEGTEFVVEVAPDGETTLSMLEGTVAVTPVGGTPQRFRAGEGVRFGQRGLRRFALKQRVKEALDAGDRDAAREIIAEELGLSVSTRAAMKQAMRRDGGARRRSRKLPHWTAARTGREEGTAKMGRRSPGRRPAAGASVSLQLTVHGSPPTFSWDPVPGAAKYGVAILRDPLGEDLVWSGVSDTTRPMYPTYGPDLEAGRAYTWLVSPLQADGTPCAGGASESWGAFTPQAHTATLAEIKSLDIRSDQGPPQMSWSPLEGASTYQVVIAAEPDGHSLAGQQTVSGSEGDPSLEERLWTAEVGESSYRYPDSARALPAGSYRARVEAYDADGFRMASSPIFTFVTAGWTSAGLPSP